MRGLQSREKNTKTIWKGVNNADALKNRIDRKCRYKSDQVKAKV